MIRGEEEGESAGLGGKLLLTPPSHPPPFATNESGARGSSLFCFCYSRRFVCPLVSSKCVRTYGELCSAFVCGFPIGASTSLHIYLYTRKPTRMREIIFRCVHVCAYMCILYSFAFAPRSCDRYSELSRLAPSSTTVPRAICDRRVLAAAAAAAEAATGC